MRHPLFHFFSSFSLFGRFFFDFFILQARLHIFCFYSFNIFLSLPRLLSSFPSFWLTFLFFCKQSHFFSFINIFYSFSPFFYPSSPFHTIFLPFTASPSRFYSFRPYLYYIFPFSVVFLPFLNSFLSFLLFPPLPSFYTLFLPFFRSSFIFSFLLMSLSPSHFSRFTSLKMFHVKHRFLRFSVFGDQ